MIKKIPRKVVKLLAIIMFSIGFIFFCIWQNNSIMISKYDYVNSKIPPDFNNFTIAHVSDLHNKMFGKNQIKLLNKVKSISPDIIVITGDLIDRRKYDLDTAIKFVSGAVKIAPVYYVSGNHEAWSGKFPLIKEKLIDMGVYILDDKSFKLSKGSSSIHLFGLSDPDFLTSSYRDGTDISKMEEQLKMWSTDKNFKILLSHRPELFNLYVQNNMDLIFTGHAHGGQLRIPGIGGLIAPDQGIFPNYTSGGYNKDLYTMFVSRGLGNSIFPIRIFNRPEIIQVTLKTQ
ncbi:metallophosphoesterase [Clostridium sp. ZBS15]|uniref:metallophosphoesterase n=1 Tax=Clostridium sp. ZBS15 TaxID=2949969 RepID=UPI002079E88B|nr:metallophosphoesterase [Clostridium sp. ZBS15]